MAGSFRKGPTREPVGPPQEQVGGSERPMAGPVAGRGRGAAAKGYRKVRIVPSLLAGSMDVERHIASGRSLELCTIIRATINEAYMDCDFRCCAFIRCRFPNGTPKLHWCAFSNCRVNDKQRAFNLESYRQGDCFKVYRSLYLSSIVARQVLTFQILELLHTGALGDDARVALFDARTADDATVAESLALVESKLLLWRRDVTGL